MSAKQTNLEGLVPEPFWYKSGVIYELHVRAFYDSDDNGVGDFGGLTRKLDYLKDLGVTALWLLPFYPSPLKDDGYDIADYYNVHPMYGTLADFKVFLREAHRRNLRVITELVMNHTSDQHPWFQRARRAKPGSRWRDFYVWSDTAEKYKDARIIFKDVEYSNWTWDPVADAYYWHRFFSHQPDLNYDNPEVHEELFKVLDFWLDLGVDGLRLDAVPYLYEREGTSCENLAETHAFLKKVRAHVDTKYQNRMLLAEANQWPEDAVAYLGQGRGDECHMAYHFPLMPRLFMAVRMEDRTPIVDILEQTPPIPETSQWTLFLRNHDELTLEMVTDEERDYMYRMYAHVHQARLNLGIRHRLAPLLGNDRKRIELLNALLMSLPGTPVIYYGDEIGMGDNIFLGDRNGVRTPMQWSSDKNAGFSRANPQSLYLPIIYDPAYHYEAVNVEEHLRSPHSLLWWMRRLLALRKRWRALGEGKCEFLQPENRKVISYILRHENETLLVVANLSRFVQPVELDLAAFRGCTPVELFGRMEFPTINEKPYFLTLNSHSFFWFSLEPKSTHATGLIIAGGQAHLRLLTVADDWTSALLEKNKIQLEAALADWLPAHRWFGGKTKPINLVTILESIPLRFGSETSLVSLVQVDYREGDSDLYAVPLAFSPGDLAEKLRKQAPQSIICELFVQTDGQRGVLYDAVASSAWCKALLDMVADRQHCEGDAGELTGSRTAVFRRLLADASTPEPAQGRIEQNNSSVIYGDKFILKLFRRLETGLNPDVEVGRFLTKREFPHAPQLVGELEFLKSKQEPLNLAILTAFVPNAQDAWTYTLDALGRYYDRVATIALPPTETATTASPLANLLQQDLPKDMVEIIGTYLDSARVLGERTAALHLTLASDPEDKAFAPEPFTPHYSRGLFQSMRNQLTHTFRPLREQLKNLPSETAQLAQLVLEAEPQILGRFRVLYERRFSARRIRCHGDFHLGQLLYTGKDFVIIDFEGEPALPLSERRIKRSPLRDAAGMVRSFDYAAWAGLEEHVKRGSLETENLPKFVPWLRLWCRSVGSVYLRTYLNTMRQSDLLPRAEEELLAMLPAYLLNKAVYEVGYELVHRPAWLHIPLRGILEILESAKPR
ncbi:MAG: maltose alpha-D-glucosyltransferase [Verrucomicrobia bacterium]|jgi:maltose alpha-D-glucosyltransferase/alpha-amylase|nr:maltose alpha-D-glucosyltransferase [Verrucomicrobiota bacterium]